MGELLVGIVLGFVGLVVCGLIGDGIAAILRRIEQREYRKRKQEEYNRQAAQQAALFAVRMSQLERRVKAVEEDQADFDSDLTEAEGKIEANTAELQASYQCFCLLAEGILELAKKVSTLDEATSAHIESNDAHYDVPAWEAGEDA